MWTEGPGHMDCRDPAGENPAEVPAERTPSVLGCGGKLYWSSVGTDGWFWSLLLVPLDWELRWYWEKPRLSSVSHGPRKDEEDRGGREEEEWRG